MQSQLISASDKPSIAESYKAVRAYSEELCRPLEIEDYVPQPIVDVSPPKWNIAHTTWFFEEMILKNFDSGYKEFDSRFGFLFNSYYNTLGDRTPRHRRGDISRPTVKEVFNYRKHVDEKILELLSHDFSEDVRKLVILGLNHEQQHQELFLTDLKYTFGVNPFSPVYRDDFALSEKTLIQENADPINIKGGVYEIGFEGEGFCFDNELSRHRVHLDDFQIESKLVTNAEFIEFIEDGGYKNHRWWHSEGWDWVNQNLIVAPLYWRQDGGSRMCFTLSGLRELLPRSPLCHVTFYEAAAYAEWKGMRLPTEPEWEVACENFEWGVRWEWTSSAYLPYPGFHVSDGAVGEYNGKFMVNQMVLRGASVATPENHSRKTYRNFFHPHLRWQFTGIRLATS